MMKQLVGAALATKTYKPEQVVFISGVGDLKRKKITDFVEAISARFSPGKNWLLLIDEIQFFGDGWREDLTHIADNMPHIKCVASGSSPTMLKQREKQTKTGGRILELHVPPLLFCEYLKFAKAWPAQLTSHDFHSILNTRLDPAALSKLNEDFINYVNYGSFPQLAHALGENASKSSFGLIYKEMKKNVFDSQMDLELAESIGAINKDQVRTFGHYLISNATTIYVQANLKKNLQISKTTIAKYLKFLEDAHFIRIVRKISGERKLTKYKHTNCKFILGNCSLPSFASKPIAVSGLGIGGRIEAALLAQFDVKNSNEHMGYLAGRRKRAGFEIDLCHLDSKQWPIMLAESKWSDDIKEFETVDGNMRYLINKWGGKKNAPPKLYCTSKSSYGDQIELDTDMKIIPSAQFSLALGVQRIQDFF